MAVAPARRLGMQVQRHQAGSLPRGVCAHKRVTPLGLVPTRTQLLAGRDADAAVESPGRPVEEAKADVTVASGTGEGRKYERRVTGFPGVVVEFDEPQEERKKGEFKLSALVLTTGGIVLMFSIITTLLSLAG